MGTQQVSVDLVGVLEIQVVTPVEALEVVQAVLVEDQVGVLVDLVTLVIAQEEALGVATQAKLAVETVEVEMNLEAVLVWKAHRRALGEMGVEEDYVIVSLMLIRGLLFRKR